MKLGILASAVRPLIARSLLAPRCALSTVTAVYEGKEKPSHGQQTDGETEVPSSSGTHREEYDVRIGRVFGRRKYQKMGIPYCRRSHAEEFRQKMERTWVVQKGKLVNQRRARDKEFQKQSMQLLKTSYLNVNDGEPISDVESSAGSSIRSNDGGAVSRQGDSSSGPPFVSDVDNLLQQYDLSSVNRENTALHRFKKSETLISSRLDALMELANLRAKGRGHMIQNNISVWDLYQSYRNQPNQSEEDLAGIFELCDDITALSSARLVYDDLLARNIEPSSRITNVMVGMYVRSRENEKAGRILEYAKAHGLPMDAFTHALATHVYRKLGNTRLLAYYKQETLELAKALNKPHQLIKIAQVLHAGQCWDCMIHVAEQLIEMGITPNGLLMSNAIHAAYKLDDMRKAMSFFNYMEQNGISPSILTCNIVLELVSQHSMRAALAEEMLKTMEKLGITPDIYTHNIMLKIYLKSGLTSKMEEYFNALYRGKKPVDIFTLNVMTKYYMKHKTLAEYKELLRKFQERKITPHARTLSTAFHGNSEVGWWLWDRHKSRDDIADILFDDIFKICRRDNLVNRAVDVLAFMRKRRRDIAQLHIKVTVELLCNAKQTEKAHRLLNLFELSRISLGVWFYAMILVGYVAEGKTAKALKVFQDRVRVYVDCPAHPMTLKEKEKMERVRNKFVEELKDSYLRTLAGERANREASLEPGTVGRKQSINQFKFALEDEHQGAEDTPIDVSNTQLSGEYMEWLRSVGSHRNHNSFHKEIAGQAYDIAIKLCEREGKHELAYQFLNELLTSGNMSVDRAQLLALAERLLDKDDWESAYKVASLCTGKGFPVPGHFVDKLTQVIAKAGGWSKVIASIDSLLNTPIEAPQMADKLQKRP